MNQSRNGPVPWLDEPRTIAFVSDRQTREAVDAYAHVNECSRSEAVRALIRRSDRHEPRVPVSSAALDLDSEPADDAVGDG